MLCAALDFTRFRKNVDDLSPSLQECLYIPLKQILSILNLPHPLRTQYIFFNIFLLYFQLQGRGEIQKVIQKYYTLLNQILNMNELSYPQQ